MKPWEKYSSPSSSPETTQAGPWSKYSSGQAPAADVSVPDASTAQKGQAFLEGLGNAISFGYLPQIQAAVESVLPKPGGDVDEKLKGQGFELPEDGYVQRRDENINRQQSLQEAAPVYSGAGSLAGSILTTPAIGAAGKLAGLGKATGAFGRLKDAALVGTGVSAISNPGDTQGEVSPIQLQERAVQGAKGAALGVLGQGFGEGVSRFNETIKAAPGLLKKVSGHAAFKAAGAIGKDFKKALRGNNAEDVGETLLNSNIVQSGDTLEEIAKKAADAKDKTGQAIGEIYKRTQEELTNPGNLLKMPIKIRKLIEATELDGEKMAADALTKIEKNLVNDLESPEVKEKVLKYLLELQGKGKTISILDLQQMKTKLDSSINYDKALKDLPKVQEQLKVVRDIMNANIQKRVRVMGIATKDRELFNTLKQANKNYGHFAKAEGIASNRARELEGQRFLSLTETITGSGGAVIGAMAGDSPEERAKNALIGFISGAALKKADKFAAPTMARAAKRLSSVLQTPANFAKYGEPIIEAAKRSPQELNALMAQLSNDPEFINFIHTPIPSGNGTYRGLANGKN